MNSLRLPHYLLGLLVVASFLVGCGEVTLLENQKFTLPLKKTLTDKQNRDVKVSIIGRESYHITFVRLSDGSRHRFPISNLSEESRAFIEQLPIVTPPPEIRNTSHPSREPGSLKFLRNSLKDLEVEIDKNVKLRNSGIQSFVQQRTLASEYKRLLNERAKIISEISDLESW